MMNSAKEQELAAQLRLIARQYCDGAFNKIEYRRQRREILQQCVEQDLSARAQPSDELSGGDSASGSNQSSRSDPKVKATAQVDWMPYLMLGVTLVVLGVMGFLLFSMM